MSISKRSFGKRIVAYPIAILVATATFMSIAADIPTVQAQPRVSGLLEPVAVSSESGQGGIENQGAYTRVDMPRPSGYPDAWSMAVANPSPVTSADTSIPVTATDSTSDRPEATAENMPSDAVENQRDQIQGFAWTPESDCASCHEQANSFTEEACTASMHEGISCLACHTDTDALVQVHESASMSAVPRLASEKVDGQSCISCHDPDTLAAATEDCEVLTDLEGTVVNPHMLPDVEDHSQITCLSCHKMHEPNDIDKTAIRSCSKCHHADVYECYTCHV